MSQVSLLLPGPPSTVVRSESFEHRAPVDRKERASNHSNPKAKAALDKERDKLIKQGCWDYSSVREWRDVSNEAISRTLGAKLLMLAASLISVSRRTPNFRSPIRIESSKARTKAITGRFSPEITSCPATMEAGKAANAFGLLPGHEIQVAGGESAYTQAKPPRGYDCPRSDGFPSGMVNSMT